MKKNTSFLKMLAIPLILTLSSCQNESTDLTQDPSISTVSKDDYTKEELLKQGWKIVKVIKLNSDLSQLNSAKTTVTTPQPVPLTESHLRDLGYDVAFPAGITSLKSAFTRNNQTPDGIWFNSGLMVGNVNTDNYAGEQPNAQIKLGTPQISNKITTNLPDDVFTTNAVNQGNTESEIDVKYSEKTGYKTTWQRKISGSFKLGFKLGFKFAATVSGDVTTEVVVGGETTDGSETSHEITKESTYKAKVAPHSKKTIKVFTKMKSTTVDYTIPFSLTGTVRTNFQHEVDGHYFWSGDITSYSNFNPNIKSETGTAKAIEYLEITVVESPAQPL